LVRAEFRSGSESHSCARLYPGASFCGGCDCLDALSAIRNLLSDLSPGKSEFRGSDVPGLHLSGLRVYRDLARKRPSSLIRLTLYATRMYTRPRFWRE
jgi:hypothetical protein